MVDALNKYRRMAAWMAPILQEETEAQRDQELPCHCVIVAP